MKKKKQDAPTEEELMEMFKKILTRKEKACPYKSASIVNENEQPIILSSDEKFETHYINTGNASMQVPHKMVPYLIKALTELYNKNCDDHFNKDQKLIDEFKDKFDKENTIKYYDLNDIEDDGTGAAHEDMEDESMSGMSDKAMELLSKHDEIKALPEEEQMEIVNRLYESKELAGEVIDAEMDGKLTPEQMKNLKEKNALKMREHLKEIEGLLTGKKLDNAEDIDLTHIKRVFEKHGPEAAKEEIMRVPVEKREAILAEMVEIFKNKK